MTIESTEDRKGNRTQKPLGSQASSTDTGEEEEEEVVDEEDTIETTTTMVLETTLETTTTTTVPTEREERDDPTTTTTLIPEMHLLHQRKPRHEMDSMMIRKSLRQGIGVCLSLFFCICVIETPQSLYFFCLQQ